ncbi:MAG: HAD-IC family P-type ATPase, partial [Synergistaceae bacterium]|nr:HAD-IC family P-type ATPase [Synergistaceae bacterium]
MNERVKILLRIVMAVLFLIPANYVPDYGLAFFMAAYLIAGYDVILEAVKGVFYGEIFDEHSLMSIATAGAIILGEYNEACAVMILYQLGELFSDYASDRSRENIIALMDLRPDYANIECHNGTTKRVSPSDVEEGSVIVIRPGEKIPIDSVILEGHSAIDTSALTGESIPRDVMAGDEILSGCVNISGALRAKTLKAFTDSAASKILQLIENSSANKSRAGKFIERFAAVYTPAVCVAALCLAVIPPMIYGNFSAWAYRALTFLVVSCPCALVVSVPLAFFAAVGGAGRRGILIKGEIFIERLAEASCVIFDKTGTLTRGVFDVAAVHPEGITEDEFLHVAAHAERYSAHPAGLALKRAYPNESDSCVVGEVEEIAGRGVRANVNGKIICAGNDKLMESAGASWHPCEKSGTIIHVSDNGK